MREPLIKSYDHNEICLVNEGYFWMQHFPSETNYCVTTIFNENKEIVQWYFDISKSIGISDQGIPYWDDLYLDIVVLPNGDIFIRDEDELEDALNRNLIEEDDYYLAKNVVDELIREITSKKNYIIKNSATHFKCLLEGT